MCLFYLNDPNLRCDLRLEIVPFYRSTKLQVYVYTFKALKRPKIDIYLTMFALPIRFVGCVKFKHRNPHLFGKKCLYDRTLCEFILLYLHKFGQST